MSLKSEDDFIWRAWEVLRRSTLDPPDPEVGDEALNVVELVARCQNLRVGDVADLVAATRSANKYQLTDDETEALRRAERILVRVSGAYTVPKRYKRFVAMPKTAPRLADAGCADRGPHFHPHEVGCQKDEQ